MIFKKRWTLLFILAATIMAANIGTTARGQATSKKMITFESLLDEMISMEEMARYPDPYYTCRQESSRDRRSVSPDAPNWFANGDGYDGGNFIRIDTINGRIEKVMLDESGPGVITRFWITSLDRQPVLRFYFDGAKEPQFIIPAYDMMQNGVAGTGKGLVIPHTSYSSDGSGGSTSFLPIPYAHGCRITIEIPSKVDKQPRYYQINYRRYESTARIETFSKEIALRAQKKIEEVNRILLSPAVPELKMTTSGGQKKLNPGDSLLLSLPKGENAVYEIVFNIKMANREEFEQVMRELIFAATFDGSQTVWVPISDFSGGGMGAPAVSSWYLSSDGHGNITSRWLMPYQKRAFISIKNVSSSVADVAIKIKTSPLKWDGRSLYFHTSWKQETGLWLSNCNEDINKPTCKEWNFCTLTGKGIYKGDVLSLYNHSKSWYGEGDEKIWVDKDTFPSHFGTGTEDYYNSSWAPVVLFQTPFGGAPRADSTSSHGYNTFFRTRNLDGIPFQGKLKFDFELLSWFPGKADYSSTVYWYGDKNNNIKK
jgi:hypothetical protein